MTTMEKGLTSLGGTATRMVRAGLTDARRWVRVDIAVPFARRKCHGPGTGATVARPNLLCPVPDRAALPPLLLAAGGDSSLAQAALERPGYSPFSPCGVHGFRPRFRRDCRVFNEPLPS